MVKKNIKSELEDEDNIKFKVTLQIKQEITLEVSVDGWADNPWDEAVGIARKRATETHLDNGHVSVFPVRVERVTPQIL